MKKGTPRSVSKVAPVRTRTLHVPKELHQEIAITAAYRDEDIQDVAVQAIRAGLPTLSRSTQSISSN